MHTTPYERRYRQEVADLVFYSRRVHVHLDWYDLEYWLEIPGTQIRLAWQDNRIAGVMGASPPLSHTSWLRVVAVRSGHPPADVLKTLWESLRDDLQRAGVKIVALLMLSDWLQYYVRYLGFHHHEDVVTLQRVGAEIPALRHSEIVVRGGSEADLEPMSYVDQAAFDPPWQLSISDLRQAQRHAASCAVAIVNDKIVGYQLSTRRDHNGHLARLAVIPNMQGNGVGKALLDFLIRGFLKRGIRSVSVNTQDSNIRSQRLYHRYGFYRTGYDLPVWLIDL